LPKAPCHIHAKILISIATAAILLADESNILKANFFQENL